MNQHSKAEKWIVELKERIKIIQKHGSLAAAKRAKEMFTYSPTLIKDLKQGDIVKLKIAVYTVKVILQKERSITLVLERKTKTGHHKSTVVCLSPSSQLLKRT